METQLRIQPTQSESGPSGLSDPFAAGADQFGGMVNVNAEDLPVSGMSLREIRSRLGDRLRIEPESIAHVNGVPIHDERRIVRTGERVEFIRAIGEKGRAGRDGAPQGARGADRQRSPEGCRS